jgi:hypothetical protein
MTNGQVIKIRWVGHAELREKSQVLTAFCSEILKGEKLSGKPTR